MGLSWGIILQIIQRVCATHSLISFFFSSACSLHIYQIYDAGTVCAALLSFLSGMYGSGDSEELQWLAKRFGSGWATPGIDWGALQGGEQLLRLHLFFKWPQLDAYQPGPLSASQQWWTQNQTFLQKKKRPFCLLVLLKNHVFCLFYICRVSDRRGVHGENLGETPRHSVWDQEPIR